MSQQRSHHAAAIGSVTQGKGGRTTVWTDGGGGVPAIGTITQGKGGRTTIWSGTGTGAPAVATIRHGDGGTTTVRSGGGGSPIFGTIHTTGKGTRITCDGPHGAFGRIENTGDDCTLTQVIDGERTVTHIDVNTTVTLSPTGQPIVAPLDPTA